MNGINKVVFLVVAVAALGAIGVTTALMTVHDAQASSKPTNCHDTGSSTGCTFGRDGGFNCNKNGCKFH